MENKQILIPDDFRGIRIDKALASILTDCSRTTIQSWLEEGFILVNNLHASRRQIVVGGEHVSIDVPEKKNLDWLPENIPLDLVHEDEQILVVNKPAGLVVHPGAGNMRGTLLNGLLHHSDQFAVLPRAGIVHRLDKNTSGLLVVAKTESARLNLVRQFKKRTISRQYLAITEGRIISGGSISEAIGRSRHNRRKMTVGHGKPAVSHYRVVSRYRAHTLVRVLLETGRTHQIRVHLQHVGFPVLGDSEYGQRVKIPKGASQELISALVEFKRQALHAEYLSLLHPGTGERIHWHRYVPEDMKQLILLLKSNLNQLA